MSDEGADAVPETDGRPGALPRRRADARRNERTLLDAAADIFVTSGVEAPVRDIAAERRRNRHDLPSLPDAGRHHHRRVPPPGRGLREAGPALLASSGTPHAALARWIDLFVDFLVTERGDRRGAAIRRRQL